MKKSELKQLIREVIKEDAVQTYNEKRYYEILNNKLQQTDFYGDLNLSNDKIITSLNKIQSIGGNLILFNSKVQDLGDLQKVSNNVDLRLTQIKSLNKLESVGGWMDLSGSTVSSLGNLKKVGRDLYINNIITFLGDITVGGKIYVPKDYVLDVKCLEKYKSQIVVK